MLIQNFLESFIPAQNVLAENYIDAHSYPPLPLTQGAVLWSVGIAFFFFFPHLETVQSKLNLLR